MNYPAVFQRLEDIIRDIATAKGAAVPKLTESTLLLGDQLPIDSLDLASVVVQMEEATGYDPFSEGFIEFRTAGDLARLYAKSDSTAPGA
jgi:acyl carrier protein